MRKPSAFVPVAMSAAALGLFIGFLVLFGVVRSGDEGVAARVFQLLIAGQLPIIAVFALRWLPRAPKQASLVLLLQLGAALTAVLPVFLLEV